ncbi:integrase, catalytic region, zinc finger, CCHC-type containing protein [Tanacetum coccineum]
MMSFLTAVVTSLAMGVGSNFFCCFHWKPHENTLCARCQYTKPRRKRKRDDTWFKISVVVQAQQVASFNRGRDASWQIQGLPVVQTLRQSLPHMLTYQAALITGMLMTLIVMKLNSAKIVSLPHISWKGSDALTSQSETDIISDSNIIPYSQYLSETQQETVQNSNSSAQQDVLILSMFDQITTQVTHCNSYNKALTTELDRYKEEVKDLKEKQNVENSFSGSNEQFAEIVHLKQNLFEQVQEKDCLIKTVSELKNKLKFEENRNIEKKLSDRKRKLSNLTASIFKRALGFEKPFCMKKARESKPKLYDVPDSDETLELSEKSRSKMLLKEQDPFELKAQSQAKDTVIVKLKEKIKSLKGNGVDSSVKMDMDEIDGVRLSISASGSQPSGNTKNDRILQTPSSNSKNKKSKKQDDSDLSVLTVMIASLSNRPLVLGFRMLQAHDRKRIALSSPILSSKFLGTVNSEMTCCKDNGLWRLSVGYVTIQGKSSKKNPQTQIEDPSGKIYLLHMDLCGPNELLLYDLQENRPTHQNREWKLSLLIRTLREYYEKVGISHETSVARSPQQNGVVERRNRTLIEAARTMLIYAKAPLFLWAEAVATACYTQNRSMIRQGIAPISEAVTPEHVGINWLTFLVLQVDQMQPSPNRTKNYKEALTQDVWILSYARGKNFMNLGMSGGWELVPPPDKHCGRPTEKHLNAVKRGGIMVLSRYSVVQSGQYTTLVTRLAKWSSKRQKALRSSSTELIYIALSGCCAQVFGWRSQALPTLLWIQ